MKNIKVTIDRSDIDERLNEKFKELVVKHKSQVRGFRPGKAPHGESQKNIEHWTKFAPKVIDLSADFRLADTAAYDAFYQALISEVKVYNITALLSMEEIKATTVLPL